MNRRTASFAAGSLAGMFCPVAYQLAPNDGHATVLIRAPSGATEQRLPGGGDVGPGGGGAQQERNSRPHCRG